MPKSAASSGSRIVTGLPSTAIDPLSGKTSPMSIFMRVDLPAPFSPRTPCISPRTSSMSTSSQALTEPYVLESFSAVTAGGGPVRTEPPLVELLASSFKN